MSSKKQHLRSVIANRIPIRDLLKDSVQELTPQRRRLHHLPNKSFKQSSATALEVIDLGQQSKRSLYDPTFALKNDPSKLEDVERIRTYRSEVKRAIRRRDKSQQRMNYIRTVLTPYICGADTSFLKSLIEKMKPVTGPTASINKSIRQYKQQNLDNVQVVIKNLRIGNFSQRMKEFAVRSSLPPDARFFITNAVDDYVKRELLSLGWHENKNRNSKFFHLKWVVNDAPHDYVNLQTQQRFNHFNGNKELTNKNYLQKNVRKYNMRVAEKDQIPTPASFDLQNAEEKQLFEREYDRQIAFSVLKQFIRVVAETRRALFERFMKKSRTWTSKTISNDGRKQRIQQKELISQSIDAQFAFQMKLMILCLSFLYALSQTNSTLIPFSRKQWQLNHSSLSKLSNNIQYSSTYSSLCAPSTLFITQMLRLYVHFSRQSQFYCYGQRNIWLVKPVGVARGSGIAILQQKQKLLEAANVQKKLIQKYLQRPMLFDNAKDPKLRFAEGKKFDIRQWVLVRRLSPLEIYKFDKCYIRLCSEAYNPNQFSNLKEHLTNYSQNKLFFEKKEESVLSLEQLKELLGTGVWQSVIEPKITKIIYNTIAACSGNMHNHLSCFEMYGFDLFVSENYGVWLLEVNLSPACQQRTPWMVEYVKEMTEGMLRILMNGEYPRQRPFLNHWMPIKPEQHQSPRRSVDKLDRTHQDKLVIIQRWWRDVLSRRRILSYFNIKPR